MLRLSRKADVDPRTRLVTSIYLPEQEFAVLAAALPGLRIRKLRHRLKAPPGVVLSADEFQGALEGLRMVEAEFDTPERMAAFAMPDFALREVTDDPRFGGGQLAANGLPRTPGRDSLGGHFPGCRNESCKFSRFLLEKADHGGLHLRPTHPPKRPKMPAKSKPRRRGRPACPRPA